MLYRFHLHFRLEVKPESNRNSEYQIAAVDFRVTSDTLSGRMSAMASPPFFNPVVSLLATRFHIGPRPISPS